MQVWMYYFANLLTFHPRRVRSDWGELKDLGCSAIVLPATEPDVLYCHSNLRRYVESAKEAGLLVHWVPARYGGMFAGAPMMASPFCTGTPAAVIRDRDGTPAPYGRVLLACANQPAFRDFLRTQIETVLTASPFDGIVLDEPKGAALPCFCPRCREGMGGHDPVRFRERSVADLMGFIVGTVKQIRPSLTTTLFHDGMIPYSLCTLTASLDRLDVFGTDGSLTNHTIPGWSKERLDRLWPRVETLARATGKKTIAVAENFDVVDGDLPEMEESLSSILRSSPDVLTLFYYPFGGGDPAQNMRAVERALKGVREGRVK